MTSRAELVVEQLVYTVAADLGLTELEERRLDVAGIATDALVGLRLAIKQGAGHPTTIDDYRLSNPENIVDLEDALRRLGERHGGGMQ